MSTQRKTAHAALIGHFKIEMLYHNMAGMFRAKSTRNTRCNACSSCFLSRHAKGTPFAADNAAYREKPVSAMKSF